MKKVYSGISLRDTPFLHQILIFTYVQDKRLAWEDMEGKWALVSDWSHEGMSAECGIGARF